MPLDESPWGFESPRSHEMEDIATRQAELDRYVEQEQDLDAVIERCASALDEYFARPEVVTEALLATAMRPFRTITKILTERGETKTLERQYRTMIYRLKGGPHVALQATLFESLAEIYRLMGHGSAAEASLEQAKQLNDA